MAAVIGSLRAELSATIAKFQEDMGKAAKTVKDLSREFSKVGNDFKKVGGQMQSVGTAMTKTLTLPLVAIGAAAFKAGKDFDEASDSIRAATGATGADLQALGQSFKTVFKGVPAEASAVAEAIGELAKRTGLTGAPLEVLTTQMLNLARLTQTQVGPLIQDTTRVFGAWQIATEDQAGALDLLFKVSQQTGVGIQTLSQGLIDAAPRMQALGFTFEESAALLGQFEQQGVDAGTVVTGLGLAVKNFAKDNIDLKTGLEQTVRQIQALGPGAAATTVAVEAFGRSGVVMADAILKGRFSVDELMASLQSSKETINTAAKDTLSFGEQWVLVKNNVIAALEPIGTRLLNAFEDLQPSILALINGLAKLAEIFAGLPRWAQTATIGIVAFAAALGPIVFLGGQVVSSLGTMILFFGKAGLGTRALVGGLTLATNALTAFRTAVIVNGVVMAEWGAGTIVLSGTLGKLAIAVRTLIATALAPLAASFTVLGVTFTGLTVGVVVAAMGALAASLYQVLGAVRDLYATWASGKSMWAFFTAKDSDNWVRRWLGLSAGVKSVATEAAKLAPQLPKIVTPLTTIDTKQPAVAGLGKIKVAIDKVAVAAKTATGDITRLTEQLHAIEGATPTFTIVNTTEALESLGTVSSAAEGILKDLEGTSLDVGHAIGTLPAMTKSWGAALADVAEDAQSMGASVKDALGKIPGLLMQAFTGGGGLSGAFKAIGVMMAESILAPIMAGLSKASKLAVTAGASMSVALGQATGMNSTMQAVTGIAVGLGGAAIAASAWGASMAAAGVAGSLALGAATLGIGAAVVGAYMLYKHFKGVTEAIKEARTAVGEFEGQLHATLTMQQSIEAAGEPWKASIIVVRDAYAALGMSAAQAEADVAAMWAAAELGPEAAKAAMDKVNASFVKLREITDAIHGMGFQTQEELQALADKAKAVFEFMERSGKYTAEQLAIAWEAFTHAQAVALGDLGATMADTAAAAGFKTRDQLQQIADKATEVYTYMRDSGLYTWAQIEEAQKRALDAQAEALGQAVGAVDSLSAKYKKLSDSISKEAPEKIMGVVEKAARAEMAALKSQMDAQSAQIKATGKSVAESLEQALDNIDPNPVHVKIVWDIPSLPGGGGGSNEAPEPDDPQGNSFAGGSGGIQDFGLGTPAMLHGREGVFTEDQISNLLEYGSSGVASPSQGGLTVNVSLTVTGPVLAEEEYVEQHLVQPIISGIERYYRPQFERLVRGVR